MRTILLWGLFASVVSAQGTLLAPTSRANAYAQSFLLDWNPVPQNPPVTHSGPEKLVNNPEWWQNDNQGWGSKNASSGVSTETQNGGADAVECDCDLLASSNQAGRSIQVGWDAKAEVLALQTPGWKASTRTHFNGYKKCRVRNDEPEDIIQTAHAALILDAPNGQNNVRKFDTHAEVWMGPYNSLKGTWEPATAQNPGRWRIDVQVQNSTGVGVDQSASGTFYLEGEGRIGPVTATFYRLLTPTEEVTGGCEVNDPDTTPGEGARINLSNTSGETMETQGTSSLIFD